MLNQKHWLPTAGKLPWAEVKNPERLTVQEIIEGQDLLLSFAGTADILCVQRLQHLFDGYLRREFRILAIDLSKTDFINSPVWAIITLFAKKKPGVRVFIVGMTARIRGSFEMMGLSRELPAYPTLADARLALKVAAAE
jgi:anti-anti-sigma regulatory factor